MFQKLKSLLFNSHGDNNEWVDTHGKVPHWVKVKSGEIKSRYRNISSNWFLNKHWIIKGGRYLYRVTFMGQGACTTVIYKKRK